MKAILEFNLPEDQEDFKLSTNALNFWHVLWELDQELRANTKYAPDDMSDDDYDAYQAIREKLYELMRDHNVSFDMVK